MTPEERANLDPNSPEYRFRLVNIDQQTSGLMRAYTDHQNYKNGRIIGSQIQIAGWTMYSTLIWSLKLSMLFFYMRLVEGLGRRYRVRIYVGFFLVISTFLSTILTIFLGCRPFRNYWQISPDPGSAFIPCPIISSVFLRLTQILSKQTSANPQSRTRLYGRHSLPTSQPTFTSSQSRCLFFGARRSGLERRLHPRSFLALASLCLFAPS